MGDDNDTAWRTLYTASSKRIGTLESAVDAQAKEIHAWAKRALAAEEELAALRQDNARLIAHIVARTTEHQRDEKEGGKL